MSDLLTFTRSERDNAAHYQLAGIINEEANLTFMADFPEGEIIINTKQVERINSCGVREWIQAIKGVPENCSIVYEECSAAFVDQINMISNFVGKGVVQSMFIPYICEDCDEKKEILIDLAVCLQDDELELPEVPCVKCSEAMELGDEPDQLFSFLT